MIAGALAPGERVQEVHWNRDGVSWPLDAPPDPCRCLYCGSVFGGHECHADRAEWWPL
jgi:hypothetical protein